MNKSILSIVLIPLLVACASTGEQGVAVEDKSVSGTGASTQGAESSALSVSALKDPNSILYKRSVYYAYDSADIEAQYRPMIEAHARLLKANPGVNVTIEGNCDERGSREYNLALGQRRAQGVKTMMKIAGAADSQMETVSNGEEKPKASGHDESDWQENRRSDLIYPGE